MNKTDKKWLVELARRAIENELDIGQVPEIFKKKQACFVTLTIGGELRGCIGHLEARQELWRDVIENARAAAFEDPRFPPLTKEEFKKVEIEISILEEPEKLKYKSVGELVDYLAKNKPGVIIKERPAFAGGYGGRRATFLPQVWEELSGVEDFLGQLCLKAGLEREEWRQSRLEIETYGVEVVK